MLCSYLVVGVLLHPISCVVFLPGCWCTFASCIVCCVLTWLLVYFCIPYRALCSYLVVGVLSHPVSCVVFLPGCWCTFASCIMCCVLTWLLVYFCILYHVLCSYLVVGVLLHPVSCVVFLPGCWCTFASHCLCVFQGECDQSFGADFEFEVHSKELIVGEIFVRIYNEQPTFPLEVSGLYIMD